MTESRELFEKVIKYNYCIGCGVCATVNDSPFKMKMNEFGNIIATPIEDLNKSQAKVLDICPFTDQAKNEDELGTIFFPKIKEIDNRIGRYINCYAGHVNISDFREKGSSGGIGKWMGYTLLKEDKIDYLIQVFPNLTNEVDKPLFDYSIISDKEDVKKGSKSSYYPTTLVNAIKKIKEVEGRYAITGVPCFIKSLRLLSLKDKVLKTRIKYTIGIICGGMKSGNQSKIIAWQLGVKPENLTAIDFRRKYQDKPASNKIYQVWSNIDDIERYRDAGEIFGTDWGAGYFKPTACDYCDDVVAETADISIGDAWLPQFVKDPKGTSIIIIRNKEISKIINRHISQKALSMTSLTADEVGKSQEGGFRQRREALSYRIAKMEKSNTWYPPKRVKTGDFKISRKRKLIYSLREKIAKQSHTSALNALNKDDLSIFINEMKPLIRKYRTANYGRLPVRALKKIKRIILRKVSLLR